jgi:probable HAF family extracellular repeat protein
MKTGEPGLRARAVFPSEAAIRALQQPHRGRRALAVPSAHGLSWLTPFVVSLLLWAGVALTPAQTEAAYAATELASLPVGSSVVRAANDSAEIVGTVGQRGFLLNGGGLQEIAGLPGSDQSAALGINNLGHVVGSANIATGMRAFRSRRTTGIVALGTLPGDNGSVALAINDPGKACRLFERIHRGSAVVWTSAGDIQALPGDQSD